MKETREVLRDGGLARARQLLRGYIPKPGEQTDLRQWEWRELAYECRPDEHLALEPQAGAVANARFLDQDTLLTTSFWGDRTFFWNWREQRPVAVLTNAAGERGVGLVALAPKHHGMFWRDLWSDPTPVHFLDFQTGVESNVGPLTNALGNVAISPDERLLAVCLSGQVEIWDLDRQTKRVRLPLDQPGQAYLQFSSDGKRLAASEAAGGLHLWTPGKWSLPLHTNVQPHSTHHCAFGKWVAGPGRKARPGRPPDFSGRGSNA